MKGAMNWAMQTTSRTMAADLDVSCSIGLLHNLKKDVRTDPVRTSKNAPDKKMKGYLYSQRWWMSIRWRSGGAFDLPEPYPGPEWQG
jgi:hypothetical protein